MRAFDRDLIRGGHYGQRPCEPHLKAEHMAAPTNAANVKKVLVNSEPSTHVQVFGCRQSRALPRAHAAGVRKAPRHEIAAGGSAAAVPQALWGFGHGRELVAGRFARAVRVEREYNLNVTARILLNGEFTFCPIHDFNELRVARERDRQLLRDELPDNVWMSDSMAIDLDFKSLDRPSWTVFDLLVKTIIVLSRVTAFP